MVVPVPVVVEFEEDVGDIIAVVEVVAASHR